MNYDKEFEKITSSFFGERKKLLLHCCCAPCSTVCIERLVEKFDITLYFYNPNIDSEIEYLKRASKLNKLSAFFDIKNIIIEDYIHSDFLLAAVKREGDKEGGERCKECFTLRLKRTAQKAVELKMDFFATTLTVSPHKNSENVNQAGLSAQKINGAKYLCSDFKKKEGYKRSVFLSNEYALYRQNYCGCEFAKAHLVQD